MQPCSSSVPRCRCVSGTRVVGPGKQQTVGGNAFQDYGAHIQLYPSTYLTVAAALVGTLLFQSDEHQSIVNAMQNQQTTRPALQGTREEDNNKFLSRLKEVLQDFTKQRDKN